VLDALKRHNVALYVHGYKDFKVLGATTADVAYFRLHGPDGSEGKYTPEQFTAWAERTSKGAEQVRTAYVYFGNNVLNPRAIHDMLSA